MMTCVKWREKHTTIANIMAQGFAAFLFWDIIQLYMLGHKEATKYLQLHKVTCWGVLHGSLKKNLYTAAE